MKFRDFHPNVRIRIILSFFGGLMSVMVMPLMAVYFAERLGAGITGMLLIVNVLVGLTSGFIGGFYADRIGRKKLMVIAEIGIMISYAAAALCNSPWMQSVWLTFAAIVAINVCWGLYGPSADAMILDVSKPEERKYIYSIQYWSNNLSSAIGGFVGALLFKHYLFELLIGLSVMGVVSSLATIVLIRESFDPRLREGRSSVSAETAAAAESDTGWRGILPNYGAVLKDKAFVVFVIASMLLVSVEFHLGGYISVRLADSMPMQRLFDWFGSAVNVDGMRMIGILRTENTLLVVLLAPLARIVFSRVNDTVLLYGGMTAYVAGYAVLSYTGNAWLLIAAMLTATLGEVMNVPVRQALLGNIPPKHARSTYMAVYGLNYKGGWMLSSAAVALGGYWSAGMMGAIVFICGMVGIVQLLFIMPELRKRRETAE